jgi:hypothetical protein
MYARFGNSENKQAKSVAIDMNVLHGDVQTSWIPYANQFSYQSFISSTRDYVKSLFVPSDLPDDVRWGFKEIRYRSVETINFMSCVFPRAYFVFLDREPTDLLASNVRAPWVINPKLKENDGSITPLQLRQHINRVMTHIMEFGETINYSHKVLGSRSLVVTYDDMKNKPEATVRRILTHVGEDQSTLNMGRLNAARESKVGTEIKRAVAPMFERDNLKKLARSWLKAQQRGALPQWVKRGR